MGSSLSEKDQALWEIYTHIRFILMDEKCEICGEKLDFGHMVGHHRHTPRSHGDHTLSNLEVRHKECEAWAHQNFKGGRLSNKSTRRSRVVLSWYETGLPRLVARNKFLRELLKSPPASWAVAVAKERYGYKGRVRKIRRSRQREVRARV